jgi:hypothetical protein
MALPLEQSGSEMKFIVLDSLESLFIRVGGRALKRESLESIRAGEQNSRGIFDRENLI